jgi:hypothetical protein
VPGWIKASVRFFNEGSRKVMKPHGPRWPQGVTAMVIDVVAMLGDQCDIDLMVITHPDHDHWNVLKIAHHGRR